MYQFSQTPQRVSEFYPLFVMMRVMCAAIVVSAQEVRRYFDRLQEFLIPTIKCFSNFQDGNV